MDNEVETPEESLKAKANEPQIVNGVKIYPTSYIPVKSKLDTPKKSLIEMKLMHIEGIHIAMFFGITIFLFISMWKRPNLR